MDASSLYYAEAVSSVEALILLNSQNACLVADYMEIHDSAIDHAEVFCPAEVLIRLNSQNV